MHIDVENAGEGRIVPPALPIRRVMFFGKSMSRSRTTGGLVDGLRANGVDVWWRNFAKLRRRFGSSWAIRKLRREFARWQPDLVFVFCMDLPRVLLDEFSERTRVVQWVEELCLIGPETQIDYMRPADLVCLSNPSLLSTVRERGLDNACFEMSGFSPRFHYPVGPRAATRDVAFIGGPGRDGGRADFILRIADRHVIDVFGVGWGPWLGAHPNLRVNRPVGPRGFRRVCAESRIVIGMNQLGGAPRYFSNRIWQTLGCGAFHLTGFEPEIDQVFARGEHLDWFVDDEDASDLIERYLPDEAARSRIAEAGHRLALEQHQYRHRIESVLARLTDAPRAENLPRLVDDQAPSYRQPAVPRAQ